MQQAKLGLALTCRRRDLHKRHPRKIWYLVHKITAYCIDYMNVFWINPSNPSWAQRTGAQPCEAQVSRVSLLFRLVGPCCFGSSKAAIAVVPGTKAYKCSPRSKSCRLGRPVNSSSQASKQRTAIRSPQHVNRFRDVMVWGGRPERHRHFPVGVPGTRTVRIWRYDASRRGIEAGGDVRSLSS